MALTLGPILLLAGETLWGICSGAVPLAAILSSSIRRAGLLWNSVALGAGVAAGGMALGTLVALAVWRRPSFRLLRWVVLAMAAVPPYVHVLGWNGFARTLAATARSARLPFVAFGGWGAAWWVQLMATLPFAVVLIVAALESLDPALIESARTLRPVGYALRRVVLPMIWPVVAAAGGLLFLLSVTDYSVPSLFQRNVYALAVFAEYSAGGDARVAFSMALPLVAIAAGAAAASQAGLRAIVQKPSWRTPAWRETSGVSLAWSAAETFGIVILVAQAAVPLLSLIADMANGTSLVRSVAEARAEIALTLGVSATAAVLCLLPAWALARAMERARPRLRWLLWIALLAPLAFPAPVVGLGLIGIWNWSPAFRPHGTLIMPVLAALARFLPLAALIVGAHLRRIDPLLLDAARVHRTSAAKTMYFVGLPLLLPGILTASFCVFVMTAGELGATLMVTPPGYQTLSVRIYNYLHYGSSSVVASLCFVLMMLALAGAAAATAAAAGWMRLLRGSESDCV